MGKPLHFPYLGTGLMSSDTSKYLTQCNMTFGGECMLTCRAQTLGSFPIEDRAGASMKEC